MKCTLQEVNRLPLSIPQLTCAYDMVLDPSGRVHLSDEFNHRLLILSSAGELIREIGGGTSQMFHYPCGLMLHQDQLVVVDSWHHRLVVLDQNGAIVRTVGELGADLHQFNQPVQITKVHDDLIYLLDRGNERILVLDHDLCVQEVIQPDPNLTASYLECLDLAIDHKIPHKRSLFPFAVYPRHLAADAQGFALTTEKYLIAFGPNEADTLMHSVDNQLQDLKILHLDLAARYLLAYNITSNKVYFCNLRAQTFSEVLALPDRAAAICMQQNRLIVLTNGNLIHYNVAIDSFFDASKIQQYSPALARLSTPAASSGRDLMLQIIDDLHKAETHLLLLTETSYIPPKPLPPGVHFSPDVTNCPPSYNAPNGHWWNMERHLLDAGRAFGTLKNDQNMTNTQEAYEALIEVMLRISDKTTRAALDAVVALNNNRKTGTHHNTQRLAFLISLVGQIHFSMSSLMRDLFKWGHEKNLAQPTNSTAPNAKDVRCADFNLYLHTLAFLYRKGEVPAGAAPGGGPFNHAEQAIAANLPNLKTFLFNQVLAAQAEPTQEAENAILDNIAAYHVMQFQMLVMFEDRIRPTFPLPLDVRIQYFNGRYGFVPLMKDLFDMLQQTDRLNPNLQVSKAMFHSHILMETGIAKTLLPERFIHQRNQITLLEGDQSKFSEQDPPSKNLLTALEIMGEFPACLSVATNIPHLRNTLQVKLIYIRVCLYLGDQADAWTMLDKIKHFNTYLITLHEALTLHAGGENHRALALIESLGDQMLCHYTSGLILRSMHQFEASLSAFEAEHRLFPTWHNLLQIHLTRFAKSGTWDTTEHESMPDETFILWNQQILQRKHPDFKSSAAALLKAEEEHSQSTQRYGEALRQNLLPYVNMEHMPYGHPLGQRYSFHLIHAL